MISLFTLCTILFKEPKEYTVEYGLIVSNSEFQNIVGSPAINLLSNPNGTSYIFKVHHCFFNGCKGSDYGSAMKCDAAFVADFNYICIYDSETNIQGVVRFTISDQSNLSQKVIFFTASSCYSQYNTFLFRTITSSRFLTFELKDSNFSMCNVVEDGVLYIQDFWLDFNKCIMAHNVGNEGLFIKYEPIFGKQYIDAGSVHFCNFNNNYVRRIGTYYGESLVTLSFNYVYFLQNDELYTIQSVSRNLPLSNIYCDNWKPGGYISYPYVISNGYSLEPHTFYRTANCWAEITPSPASSPYNTPYITPFNSPYITPYNTPINTPTRKPLTPQILQKNNYKFQPFKYY